MYREKFYLTEDIPEVFKLAQALVDKKYPSEELAKDKIEVPMPTIRSNPNVQGPVKVTKKWYAKEKEKVQCRRLETEAEAEVEYIRLLAQRDRIMAKLPLLDPARKKDAKKIAALNCRLKIIEEYIADYQKSYNFTMTELSHGNKIKVKIQNVKRSIKRGFKRIKRFFHDHEQALVAVIGAVASLAVVVGLKWLLA